MVSTNNSNLNHLKTSFLSKSFIFLVRFYQYSFSYFFGGNCRFYPSCSEYAIECFQSKKTFQALFLTLKRLLKCHPLSKQKGFDPVP